MTPPTIEEQDSSLAALISTVAEGKPLTALEKARLRLGMVDQARETGLSWAAIGSVYGMSGREMKREARKLRERVRRELMLAGNRDG